MTTTTKAPEDEREDSVRRIRAQTEREAASAPTDRGRRRRMAELTKYAGTCPDMMTVEELRERRWRREKSFGESVDRD